MTHLKDLNQNNKDFFFWEDVVVAVFSWIVMFAAIGHYLYTYFV